MTEPSRDQPTFVYFIAAADRRVVKIGCTGDVQKRLKEHQGSSPVSLHILASAPASIDDERAIHAALLRHHSHFEWFHFTPEISALVEAVRDTGHIPPQWRGRPGQPNPLNGRRLKARALSMKDAA